MITRRLALFRIGVSTAAATAAAVPAILEAKAEPKTESRKSFETPAEYLAAMQAIGWRPVAMFQRLRDGGVHRMGVAERSPMAEGPLPTREKFHAIQMRTPVQLPMDVHPGGWWGQVWQSLYDLGFREDVASPNFSARFAGAEEMDEGEEV